MEKKVIVAGHACVDITPLFPKNKSAADLNDILCPGKLVQMDGVDIHTGGLVSNTGLAMKLFGADVSLMTKIGKDAFGDILRRIYAGYGAAGDLIEDEGSSTSYSIVLAVPGIDRLFLHDPGANDTFTFSDIPKEKISDTALFHFGYPPLMKKMYEQDGAELVKMMKYLKENGTATSMDMAAVDADSPAGYADWRKILSGVLPYVDFFTPSIEELCFMLDRVQYDEWVKRADGKDITSVLDIGNDVKPLVEECMQMGAKVLLIKCGAPGFYFKTAPSSQLAAIGGSIELRTEDWANREGFEKSYIPRKVLSATGAGDTTVAAFLAAMLKGYPFDMCIHLASAAGASCVEAYDAISGLKPLEVLKEKIKLGWKKR
jgi:sugar/nucleoside kinase (ribokinase family)